MSKNVLFTFILWIMSILILKAQSPDAINYQAIIRDNNGNPQADQDINVRLTIFSGQTPTTLVFEEEHTLSTNSQGLFTLAIGEGTTTNGNFTEINWGNDAHHLNVEIDTGDGYFDMGTLPFLSVPYALHSKKADSITLPFEGIISAENKTGFQVINSSSGEGLALAGIQGNGSGIEGLTRSAILGNSESGYGIAGLSSAENPFAGVWGSSDNATGVGVYGSATSGGIAGLFETNGDGPALVTSGGFVGIGIAEPEKLLHVDGEMFINTLLGAFELGYPDGGNRWRISTLNSGADLQFFSSEEGTDTNIPRMIMKQNGQIGIGDITVPTAYLEIKSNSTISQAHLALTEVEQDFARLTFQNTNSENFWSVSGYTDESNNSDDKLNFYHSSYGDIMTVRGNGNVGINISTPSGRFQIFQGSQTVGTGLRISDGINEDWDITHGFGLRLHFGGSLRGFFNASSGAYVQSSDLRLKSGIEILSPVLSKLKYLQPLKYHYIGNGTSDKTIGFIAQEVASLFPELVHYSKVDDLYGLDYSGFGVIAIKAIQEQQAVIESQKQLIEDMQQRLEALEALIIVK